MKEPIISVSGLRGVIGESMTPQIALRYAIAFSAVAPQGPFVIARDSRPTGRLIADAIHAGLNAAGRDTLDAGIAATPTTGVLVRHSDAAGGIQITASHNPSQYNGMKLFSSEGRVIPAIEGEKVLQSYRHSAILWVSHDRIGNRRSLNETLSTHLAAVMATVDVDKIRKRRFRVLLDSNHGAGSILGRRLLEELGCQATILGEVPDGQFDHIPEPISENLSGVCAAIADSGAEIGFCQDPDADRLAVIDASGRYLGEEYTLALCVDHVLRKRKGPIVTNCSSSRMTQDLAENSRVPIIRSAVGEANVVDAMLANNALFGGEGNGGPIDPRVGFVRDSFVGMALLLDAMAERETSIGDLADALPRYEIVKTKLSLDFDAIPAALAALECSFPDARPDRLDGLRLDWPRRWLLVRGSNTEPIVRIIAEAPTKDESQQLCDEAADILRNV